MKSETFVFGKIIKKYQIDMNLIKDLNHLYEVEKDKLFSLGKKCSRLVKMQKRTITNMVSLVKS